LDVSNELPSPSVESFSSKEDGAATDNCAGPDRLNIAVLIDYANFTGGGYECHLREALDAKCRREGHNLFLLYGASLDAPHALGKADNAVFSVLRSESFDGFIVASSSLAAFSGPERVARLIEGLRPASVCSFGLAMPGIPSLVIDNRTGLEAVIEHLISEHGYRRPVFLAGPPKSPDAEERLQVYRDVLDRHGLPFDPRLVVCANFRHAEARIAMDQLLRRDVAFDSVVAANDPMALGAIETLRKWGRRVPRDLPVTGFDDLLLARLCTPPLTTVAQPFARVAEAAVDCIVNQLSGRPVPDRVVVPTEMVRRQSCGCDVEEHVDAPISQAPGPESGMGVLDRLESLRPRLKSSLHARAEDSELVSSRLIDAYASVIKGQTAALRRAAGDLLEEIGEQNQRHRILHEAMTWLREETSDLCGPELERAFYQGMSLIALSSSSTEPQQLLSVDDSYFRLLTVGGEASVAFDLLSLKQALGRGLPAAGIRTIFLSCAASSASTELVPLVCLVDGVAVEPPETSLPSSRLLPSMALRLERRCTFLVFPLALGSELLGIAAMDYLDGINTFTPFRSEITLVLRSIHLHQDLVQETMLRERSVQERLATTKRMEALSVLAGGVAHDLNNALGPLVILPEVILDELGRIPIRTEGMADLRADVESIHSSSLRAAQTIKDLLTLGRQGRTALENLDLRRVVKSCVADRSLRSLGDPMRVSVVLDLPADPLFIRGSESQLARAVGNLIHNAIDATAGGGEVRVRISRVEIVEPTGSYENIPPGQFMLLSVSDHGCGIRKEDISRVFEPFFTTKPAGERSGSGLGLAIVHGVVKEHKGFIDVRSAPDMGTTFALYFPVAPLHPTRPQELTPIPHGHGKILVVDDEWAQLRTYQRVLTRLGYQVEVVQSGLAAQELFRNAAPSGPSPFDLIIVDMALGENLDGLQVFESIQQWYPAQRAIVASGHAPNERAELAMKKGLAWITKPYDMETLARVVERALAGRRPAHRIP
jgi:DNA-binding LacI/PurR family transcriptional regulator/signal transduction histidine kinase/ActR/RegA family two-component response regulator